MTKPLVLTSAQYNAQQAKKVSEKTVVKQIVAALESRGYVTPALAASGRVEFPIRGYFVRIAQRRADWAGQDAGAPDLIVRVLAALGGRDHRYPFWAAFEIKRPHGGVVSPAQKVLVDCGATHVVTSADEVLRILGETV